MEIWSAVPGWEGIYEVSDRGQVRSLDRLVRRSDGSQRSFPGRLLKGSLDNNGYRQVDLCRPGARRVAFVHHLVLEAFVGFRPDGMECRHLDGDTNNNELCNLAWGTPAENSKDRARHNRSKVRLSYMRAQSIRAAHKKGRTTAEISKSFSVPKSTVSRVIRGRNWKRPKRWI